MARAVDRVRVLVHPPGLLLRRLHGARARCSTPAGASAPTCGRRWSTTSSASPGWCCSSRSSGAGTAASTRSRAGRRRRSPCSAAPPPSASRRRRSCWSGRCSRAGFRYRPVWGVRGVGLSSARRVAGWTFLAVLLGQLGLLVTTNVANTAEALNAGSALQESTPAAAAYSYAYLLFMLPHSLVAVSLVTALFTRMSHAAGEDDWPTVRDDLSLGLRTVGIFSVLATVGLVVLADPVGVAMTGSVPGGEALGSVVWAMALGLTGVQRHLPVPAGLLRLRGRPDAVLDPGAHRRGHRRRRRAVGPAAAGRADGRRRRARHERVGRGVGGAVGLVAAALARPARRPPRRAHARAAAGRRRGGRARPAGASRTCCTTSRSPAAAARRSPAWPAARSSRWSTSSACGCCTSRSCGRSAAGSAGSAGSSAADRPSGGAGGGAHVRAARGHRPGRAWTAPASPRRPGRSRSWWSRGWSPRRRTPPTAARRSSPSPSDGREELRRVRTANGERVAARLARHPDHTTADLATAVAVLRRVLAEDGTPDTTDTTGEMR